MFIHGALQVDHVFVAGHGTDVDRDLIRARWSLRCLLDVRWLVEHGFGPPEEMPEVAVPRSRPWGCTSPQATFWMGGYQTGVRTTDREFGRIAC